MGIFSQDKTTTNQTAYNQQVGVSNRDLSGSQVTGAAGANTGGQFGAFSVGLRGSTGSTANVTFNSLDSAALQTAAFTINHAIDVTDASNQSNLQGFQNALSVVAEHQQSAADLASGQQSSLLGQVGVSPQTLYIVAGVIGLIVIIGMFRHK